MHLIFGFIEQVDLTHFFVLTSVLCIMRKPEVLVMRLSSPQISCTVTAQLISAFVFATWYNSSTS